MSKNLIESITQTVLDYLWTKCIKPGMLKGLVLVDWGFRFGLIWCIFRIMIGDKEGEKKTKLVFAAWLGTQIVRMWLK